MIPHGLDLRTILGPDAMSYSEMASLSNCEQKWAYSYQHNVPRPRETSVAMQRGTDIHTLIQHYWKTGEVIYCGEDTADWLIERYAKQYPVQMSGTINVEQPFAVQIPQGPLMFGYMDGVQELPSGSQVWEIKSTGAIEDVLYLERSPQMALYYLAAQSMYNGVKGVTLDLVRTYKPKRNPDALPIEDSFRRIELTFTDTEIEELLAQLDSAYSIKRDLRVYRRTPMKHISRGCGYCSFIGPCSGRTVTLKQQGDN